MRIQKITRLFLLLTVLIFSKETRSQTAYTKIVYARYEADLPKKMKNDHISIFSYAEISKGSINFIGKDFKTGEVIRTSYKLNETELQAFNTVFNGKMPLKKEIIDTNQVEGQSYGSHYEYCVVKFANGKKDELCFMFIQLSLELSDIMDMIDDIYYNKATSTAGSTEIPSYLYADILKLHKKSTYLPTAGGPPPPEEQ